MIEIGVKPQIYQDAMSYSVELGHIRLTNGIRKSLSKSKLFVSGGTSLSCEVNFML
jgi:hypothetical protein